MSTTILGISSYYHDSAACLLRDGQIVAAVQEERFTRLKNDKSFPINAINFCLDKAGITGNQLDHVVYYEKPFEAFERMLMTFFSISPAGGGIWVDNAPGWFKQKLKLPKILFEAIGYTGDMLYAEHHESHAASAFYPSPFESAAVLTMDGVGEWATTTCSVGRGNRLDIIKQIDFPHSLGLLYSAFTAYTGFKVNSGEYKLMGLAPYGEPVFKDKILDNLLHVNSDGSFALNMEYFSYLHGSRMTNDRFHDLFGAPPREQESGMDRRVADLAASVQAVTEEITLKIATNLHKETGEKYLCLAGGVALNCVSNSRLLREGPFSDIWVQPAAGDAGGALGAALAVWYRMLDNPRTPGKRMSCYLGPEYSGEDVREYLEMKGYPYSVLSVDERAATIADMIFSGMVVGHMAGPMEFGPRALGNRSILGDPCSIDTQHVINQKIKYRESFRPFAPSVLEESISSFFDADRPNPYMLFTAPVISEKRKEQQWNREQDIFEQLDFPRSDIPAVTHVDYSARLQSVSKEDNPRYHAIISEFEKKAGVPIVVNTSFNVRGEPIVCSPDDAYRCFMNTDMDALVMEDVLLLKSDQPSLPIDHGLEPTPSLNPLHIMKKSRLPALITLAFFLFALFIEGFVAAIIFGTFFLLNLGCVLAPTFFKPVFRLLHLVISKIQAFISTGILRLTYYSVITPVGWIWRFKGSTLVNAGRHDKTTWKGRDGFQPAERFSKRY